MTLAEQIEIQQYDVAGAAVTFKYLVLIKIPVYGYERRF